MNFSEAMFYEKLFEVGFPYKHCYFKTYLPTRQNGVENRDKAYKGYEKPSLPRSYPIFLLLVAEERLHDEPKKRLRGRLR